METDFLRHAACMRHGYTLAMAPNGTACLRAGAIEEAGGVRHGFSLRCGGVSEGAYESLNLSMSRMESAEAGRENFMRFCEGFGYDYDSLAIINYEHGNTVLPLTREHAGQGFGREPLPFCDGLITDDPGDFVAVDGSVLETGQGEPVTVQGTIDCYFREGDRWILLDYKSNYLEETERAEAAILEMYRSQLELYRLALEQIRGIKVDETYLYLFTLNKSIPLSE